MKGIHICANITIEVEGDAMRRAEKQKTDNRGRVVNTLSRVQ